MNAQAAYQRSKRPVNREKHDNAWECGNIREKCMIPGVVICCPCCSMLPVDALSGSLSGEQWEKWMSEVGRVEWLRDAWKGWKDDDRDELDNDGVWDVISRTFDYRLPTGLRVAEVGCVCISNVIRGVVVY
jgi:hypothetical protein